MNVSEETNRLDFEMQVIELKSSFLYRYTITTKRGLSSIKKFVLLPFSYMFLFKKYIDYKLAKICFNVWYLLDNSSFKLKINVKNKKQIEIKGVYFANIDEKKNAALMVYKFTSSKNISQDEMRKLGFNFSDKLGYFNYIDTSSTGEHSFSKFIRIPDNVSKVRVIFKPWYNKSKLFLKIMEVRSTAKTSTNILQNKVAIQHNKINNIIYSDEITHKDKLALIGWPEISNPDNKPVVLGVMDEFTTGCFEEDVCLIQPRPDNWLAMAKKYKPDLVFIESAWQGNFGSWQFRVADYTNKPGDEIEQLANYCKQKDIPMVFWNKEDPVHHQKFMCTAQLVSHIFTTDTNMIPSYIEKTDNKNVYTLPFSAQPSLHKPKALKSRINKSCFAGSWYGNRHEERGAMMVWLLEAANEYGLDIFDRNYDRGIMPFPEQYADGIKGALPYKQLCTEYSKYRIFLNVNSVVNSPTMFSRRVFELMACGTPVVSTYAKGIEDFFDSDAVWLVKNELEALEAIKTLMTNDVEWRRRSLLGIREVYSKHTYAHRWKYIFDHAAVKTNVTVEPKISLLANANSVNDILLLNEMLKKQEYKNSELYIKFDNKLPDHVAIESNVTVSNNFDSIKESITDYIGWLDTGFNYGEFYLRDLINAILYEKNANGWAKSINVDEFEYSAETVVCASIWKKEVFASYVMQMSPNQKIIDDKLFVIDSDQINQVNCLNDTVIMKKSNNTYQKIPNSRKNKNTKRVG